MAVRARLCLYAIAKITSATSATVVPGNRVQLVPYNQFALVEQVPVHPMWAAALGIIYFGDSFASSDDTVRLPGFVRFDAARLCHDRRELAGAAQRREHLQHGLLGVRRRQQQHLAGPAATVRVTAITGSRCRRRRASAARGSRRSCRCRDAARLASFFRLRSMVRQRARSARICRIGVSIARFSLGSLAAGEMTLNGQVNRHSTIIRCWVEGYAVMFRTILKSLTAWR